VRLDALPSRRGQRHNRRNMRGQRLTLGVVLLLLGCSNGAVGDGGSQDANPVVDGGETRDGANPSEAGAFDAGAFDTGVARDAAALDDAGGAPLVWFSDWRTATGDTQLARYDGTRWTGQLCEAPVLEVMPAAVLGFPTRNALRMRYRRQSECQMLQVTNRWSAPPVGGSLVLRFYVRNDLPEGSAVGNPHPLHLGRPGAAGAPYALWFNFGAPTGGRARMVLQLGGGPEYPDRFWSFAFASHVVHRVEVRVRRLTMTTATVDLHVFDATGRMLGDSADWNNGETGANLRTLAQSAPVFPVNDDSFTLVEVGNNGPAGLQEYVADRFVTFGAVAVLVSPRSDLWAGPWPLGAEALP
jgi:hypothetical protein